MTGLRARKLGRECGVDLSPKSNIGDLTWDARDLCFIASDLFLLEVRAD